MGALGPLLCRGRGRGFTAVLPLADKTKQNKKKKKHLDTSTCLLVLVPVQCVFMTPDVAKGSGKVRNASKGEVRGKVLRLHTVFRVLTQSEDLVSSLRSIYTGTCC